MPGGVRRRNGIKIASGKPSKLPTVGRSLSGWGTCSQFPGLPAHAHRSTSLMMTTVILPAAESTSWTAASRAVAFHVLDFSTCPNGGIFTDRILQGSSTERSLCTGYKRFITAVVGLFARAICDKLFKCCSDVYCAISDDR